VLVVLPDGFDHDLHLHDFRYHGTEYGFTYPPFAAPTLSPLAITSWPVAIAAAALLDAGAVALLIRWHFVPILRRRGWPLRTPCALMFLGFLVFEPPRDAWVAAPAPAHGIRAGADRS
jgi:alpha-1,2-mannosyltransferase